MSGNDYKKQILLLLDEAEDELIKLIERIKNDTSLDGYDYFLNVSSPLGQAEKLHETWFWKGS